MVMSADDEIDTPERLEEVGGLGLEDGTVSVSISGVGHNYHDIRLFLCPYHVNVLLHEGY